MNHIPAQTCILIVDDDPSLLRTMALILERRGYQVKTAVDGSKAIELVRAQPFDMILMDIRMPVMDGVEALKQIKSIRPEAVVTMMTAYAIEDLLQDALAEGAFALLNKPVDIEKVVALIDKAWQAKQGALVLIVDDDPDTRITLTGILAQKGYRVCTAGSGEEAVERSRQQALDILLIDLKLPALNGLETYLAIKEVCPQAVAIIFTAYLEQMDTLAELALEKNAYACLYKPLDIDRLLELLREIEKRQA